MNRKQRLVIALCGLASVATLAPRYAEAAAYPACNTWTFYQVEECPNDDGDANAFCQVQRSNCFFAYGICYGNELNYEIACWGGQQT